MTMRTAPRDDSSRRSDAAVSSRILAAGLACAACCGAARSCGIGGAERAPWPYVWPDVAAVYLLSASPLAALVAVAARRRFSAAAVLGLSAAFLAAGLALSQLAAATAERLPGEFFSGAAIRTLLALALVTAAVLAGAFFVDRPPRRERKGSRGSEPAAGVFAATALLLVPSTYVDARRRHDAAELRGLLEQSRLREAQTLMTGMLLLAPAEKLEGRPLRSAAAAVAQATRELETRTARPLPAGADESQQLNRVRDLAMLGRTAAALEVLESWPEWTHSAPALNLCGTIHETSGEWEPGLACYLAAKRAWEATPRSAQRTAGLIQATTGVAYCARKLGRYGEAETAYLQRLALSPSADAHFLLASFYEDIQRSGKARHHARLAMALSPERYGRQGKQLIDKLDTLHFGCLGGLFAEQTPLGASPAAGGNIPESFIRPSTEE